METRKITHFPYLVPEPRYMKPIEQVMCMVYLAHNYSLEELRAKQDIIEQQIIAAHKHHLSIDNLSAMQDNLCATVAYQAYPDDDLWMSFIRQT